jgi:hypothetical protein
MSRHKNPNPQPLRNVCTRMPRETHIYLRALATRQRYTNLKNMNIMMLAAFIREEPWNTIGLEWRDTKNAVIKNGDKFEVTGWTQTSSLLPEDVVLKLEKLANAHNVSIASAFYTAIYWWTNYVNPPSSFMPSVKWDMNDKRDVPPAVHKEIMSESIDSILNAATISDSKPNKTSGRGNNMWLSRARVALLCDFVPFAGTS